MMKSTTTTTYECNHTSTKSKTVKVSIGGSKGHLSEQVDGFFAIAFDSFRWKMIPNCTGRYTCRDHKQVSTLTPMELIRQIIIVNNNVNESTKDDSSSQFRSFEFTFHQKEKDPIIVIPFDDHCLNGLISYVKVAKDSTTTTTTTTANNDTTATTTYVHTLNAPSGFQRKLQAIGIEVKDDGDIIQKENL